MNIMQHQCHEKAHEALPHVTQLETILSQLVICLSNTRLE